MENTNNTFEYSQLAVIIPFNGVKEEDQNGLLDSALESVPSGVDTYIIVSESYEFSHPTANVLSVSAEGDFCSLVNAAMKVLSPNYKYVSILEFDDTFNKDVFSNNVKTYIEETGADILLPLTYMIDYEDKSFVGFINETPLAMAFSENTGVVDEEMLKEFFAFNLTGAVIKKDLFDKYDGLRGNIKLYFWYEWMYRVVKNGAKALVMPKVTYNHYINRKNSLFAEYQKTFTQKESKFWFETAQKSSELQIDDTNYTYTEEKGK